MPYESFAWRGQTCIVLAIIASAYRALGLYLSMLLAFNIKERSDECAGPFPALGTLAGVTLNKWTELAAAPCIILRQLEPEHDEKQ